MNITKNWFYKLSELKTNNIIIEDNIIVSLFDDLNEYIDIEIWESSRLDFFGFHESSDVKQCKTSKVSVKQCKTGSKLKINYLILWNKKEVLKKEIISDINASNVKSDVKILSIIMNDWYVDLDWVIRINKGVEKVDWNLVEDNLFLGDNWKIKWIPTLLVRSDDVKASHACKMERISDEKLFYLRSRWVGKENALSMMIEAKIKSLFSCISMLDNTFYEELVDNIIKKVK